MENRESDAIFLLEFINTSAGIHKFLLTGKERMAGRANFHAQILLDRSALKRIPASASYRSYVIIRMNRFFHYLSPLSALNLRTIQSKWTHKQIIAWTDHLMQLVSESGGRNMGIASDRYPGKLLFQNLNGLLHSVKRSLRFGD